jgi:hypothetical protein
MCMINRAFMILCNKHQASEIFCVPNWKECRCTATIILPIIHNFLLFVCVWFSSDFCSVLFIMLDIINERSICPFFPSLSIYPFIRLSNLCICNCLSFYLCICYSIHLSTVSVCVICLTYLSYLLNRIF